ncbi:transposase [Cohnella thermotolerans]|uniref:transposase n=1 Tax=Cohnella thermotolerans TaxID=329858 RepID=UPI000686C22D|nr:transposase [Cohnella thermotolerans]
MDWKLSIGAFSRRFATEEACARKLYEIKWPEGYVCPLCRHREASVTRTRRLPLYECLKCRHQTSLTVGTAMEKSKTPLRKWFLAIYWLTRGVTARQLSKEIRVTYKTAWLIAHKIRHAIRLTTSELPLTGHVRVNEDRHGPTSLYSVYRRNVKYQTLIAAASISEEGKLLRVKLHQVPAEHLFVGVTTRYGMRCFLQQCVASEADLKVAPGIYNSARYRPLNAFCYEASRFMNEIYCGIGPKHLQAYLDEYGYRFNFTSREESIVRDLLRQCVARPVITYPKLTRKAA